MKQNLTTDTPLAEWLNYLEHLHSKTIDMGLERVSRVAEKMQLLHPSAFVITVAGTNGKGTTCRLLETILLNAGYRVGVYSSPHILRYEERVRIQGQELPANAHTQAFAAIEQQRCDSLTYFEFSTLAALWLFEQANLDVIILEVGLGGRLDATNIIDTDLAIITSIDLDHTAFLGNTREQIGFEKAGICRAHKPLVVGEPNCPESIKQQAEKLHCQAIYRGKDFDYQQSENSWCWQSSQQKLTNLPLCHIPLPNAATALAALQFLPFDIGQMEIIESLAKVELAGRFQFLEQAQLQKLATTFALTADTMPQIVLDVGHNPHAARYLATQLAQQKAHYAHIYAVCGILKDKDAEGVLQPLLPLINEWICVPLAGERGQAGEVLQQKLNVMLDKVEISSSVYAVSSMLQGVELALKQSQKEDLILVFGSFHTVADFLTLLE
ncbi:bifunctional tetrahydrofolate synthase/dihydrofolate synthase [Gallibacterium salpingitidis]|uniref:bifunctional tetrahydrofolate synthase/dihydrofolate synthase n=1 Tax=Gallibacterium salpingitidis TaxID=505341 RepID=UPI002670A48B|nr:bifunctional tetrahydrofolate synthase/dihydrofolate synthase [Gallibacterium salpingitidis]WKT00821.1 bifunctional tetrahydrofolate synthase/dihydrofolate synthase [Gallibacterium salpingitidis]